LRGSGARGLGDVLHGDLLLAALCVAAIQGQSISTYFSQISSTVKYMFQDRQVVYGFILGLQANPSDTTHQCATSFQTLMSMQDALPTFVAQYDATIQNGYYNYGSYIKLAKRYYEIYQSQVYQIFDYCNIEDALISVGKTVSTFSGAFNGVVNGLFRIFSDSILKGEMSSAIAAYESASSTTTDANNLGIVLGQFFQKLFEMQVPSYQYNDFTTS